MNAPPDDERLYALLREEAWLDALGWVHRAWRALDGDARARRAARALDDAFFADLDARPTEALERRLLLHHGRMHALPAPARERLVALLEQRRARKGRGWPEASGQPGSAAPGGEKPAGAAAPHGGAAARETLSPEGAPVQVVRVGAGGERGEASLFKSPQERVFFDVLRRTFPTHVAYPNAALSGVLSYERLQGRLSQAERDYFFRGLVDAVVVDPADDWRPVCFFELDSAHHDRGAQRRNDRLKDAILAKAGQTLFRLRQAGGEAGPEAFAEALRTALRASGRRLP